MKQTVLTVDDSRTMRSMLSHYLVDAGYNVVTAEDGADGVRKLEENDADIIITDINMPIMDGFEFIEQVRGGVKNSRLPILVLTTESDQEKRDRARKAGATGWIVKPFDPDKLITAVRRVAP